MVREWATIHKNDLLHMWETFKTPFDGLMAFTDAISLGNHKSTDKPVVPVQRVSHDRNDIEFGWVITFLIIGCLLCFWGIKLLNSPSLFSFLPGISLTLLGGSSAFRRAGRDPQCL